MSAIEELRSYVSRLQRRFQLAALARGSAIVTAVALHRHARSDDHHQSLRLLDGEPVERPGGAGAGADAGDRVWVGDSAVAPGAEVVDAAAPSGRSRNSSSG